jgi:hypothetical protein
VIEGRRQVLRGLLLLALSGFAAACSDDQSVARRGAGAEGAGDRPDDGGSRRGDSGGRDAASQAAAAQCRSASVQTAGAACVACVCETGPDETVACGPVCWALVACIQVQCGGDGSDFPCIMERCDAFLGDDAPVQAIAFDPIIRMCEAECVAPILDGGR